MGHVPKKVNSPEIDFLTITPQNRVWVCLFLFMLSMVSWNQVNHFSIHAEVPSVSGREAHEIVLHKRQYQRASCQQHLQPDWYYGSEDNTRDLHRP